MNVRMVKKSEEMFSNIRWLSHNSFNTKIFLQINVGEVFKKRRYQWKMPQIETEIKGLKIKHADH